MIFNPIVSGGGSVTQFVQGELSGASKFSPFYNIVYMTDFGQYERIESINSDSMIISVLKNSILVIEEASMAQSIIPSGGAEQIANWLGNQGPGAAFWITNDFEVHMK